MLDAGDLESVRVALTLGAAARPTMPRSGCSGSTKALLPGTRGVRRAWLAAVISDPRR